MRAYLLPVLAMGLLATGCATTERREEQAYTYCPAANNGAWRFLSEPPANAADLLKIAAPEPKPPFTLQRVRLFWFTSTDGQLLLCRTVLDVPGGPDCVAKTWIFKLGSSGWSGRRNAADVCVVM